MIKMFELRVFEVATMVRINNKQMKCNITLADWEMQYLC